MINTTGTLGRPLEPMGGSGLLFCGVRERKSSGGSKHKY